MQAIAVIHNFQDKENPACVYVRVKTVSNPCLTEWKNLTYTSFLTSGTQYSYFDLVKLLQKNNLSFEEYLKCTKAEAVVTETEMNKE